MTVHVLLQCTKTKAIQPEPEMIWNDLTDIEQWNAQWCNIELKLPAKEMYTGRSIRGQINSIESIDDCTAWVVSAGAGLVHSDELIPAYEATFGSGSGPEQSEWHQLPMGGLRSLSFEEGDTIVCFLPPMYERAILSDPMFASRKHAFVTRQNSILSKMSPHVSVQIHPRSKEALKVASVDLNAALTILFLQKGLEGMKSLYTMCEMLPTKPQRTKVCDEELEAILSSLDEGISLNKAVRILRDDLRIAASYERIRAFLRHGRS